jgi:hypothetical protein
MYFINRKNIFILIFNNFLFFFHKNKGTNYLWSGGENGKVYVVDYTNLSNYV